MKPNIEERYLTYINELREFQNQGEDLNLEDFEAWKERVANDLPGSFAARFKGLEFYKHLDHDFDNLPF